MSEELQKSYYAIIPANVRYDPDLTPNAKLLYGEITALTNDKGYCWASNNYFANLYGTSVVTISRWIKSLKDKGYIKVEMKYREGTKEIDKRYIQICKEGINKNDNTPINKNDAQGINKNVKENITYINTTYFNNTSNIKKKLIKEKKDIFKDKYFENKDLNDLFIDFLKLRKELKARNTERAIKSLLKTLSEYDDETKYKMIDKSIRNSWKDVFPLKENKPYQSKPIREEIIPKWFNKNNDKETPTAAEQNEMEDLLREFDNP